MLSRCALPVRGSFPLTEHFTVLNTTLLYLERNVFFSLREINAILRSAADRADCTIDGRCETVNLIKDCYLSVYVIPTPGCYRRIQLVNAMGTYYFGKVLYGSSWLCCIIGSLNLKLCAKM
jgi:hypothetical protein